MMEKIKKMIEDLDITKMELKDLLIQVLQKHYY